MQFATSGHNLLLTGQAGAGKSRVVGSILQKCKSKNLRVAVLCSSGIACKVYPPGIASTVHSYYGLGTADLPSRKLLERAKANSVVHHNIENTDASARMVEIVNCLRHEMCTNNSFLFAGRQIIFVGEFLQLRPVPSKFDEGKFMFNSDVFNFAVTHRFELTEIMRQLSGETNFINSLKDLRIGQCSAESLRFLSGLSRDLPPELACAATHIFFKKIPAALFNRSVVEILPGDAIRLQASHEGITDNMKWPGEDTLILKKSAKEMLVWNKTETLKNGSVRTFEGVRSDGLVGVRFD